MLRNAAKSNLIRSHRVLLVVSTLTLGIFGSRIATDMTSLGDWLVATGATVAIYLSDLCREIEDSARVLSGGSQERRIKARIDLFDTRSPEQIIVLAAIAVTLVGLGMAVTLGLDEWLRDLTARIV